MKNTSITWGVRRIHGELLKIDINLSVTTIWNILRLARKQGKIMSSLTWKKFLTTQIESIFAMDFFTVDTIFNKRYYIYIILHHKTREVVQFAITENPVKQFVKQQLILFKEEFVNKTYMIHDGIGEFIQSYVALGISNIQTSFRSPNMNAFVERVIRSIREEALDNFLIFNRRQIKWLLEKYIQHYNSRRPHQSLAQQSPKGYVPYCTGKITKRPVLGGLFFDYFRVSEGPI